MNKRATPWIFVTLLGLSIVFLFILVLSNYRSRFEVPVTTFFFLLIIFDLGATYLLTKALRSAASYSGTVLKGNLKLTGPAVVFFLILLIGYRFRPVEKSPLFNMAIYVAAPAGDPNAVQGTISILADNDVINAAIDVNGKAMFPNLNRDHLGDSLHLTSRIEGYKISKNNDTVLPMPGARGIQLKLLPAVDSILYVGYILKRNNIPVAHATVKFSDYLKNVQTDEDGMFHVYLRAKPGERADVMVFKDQVMRYSDKIYLGKNIKIVIDD